MTPIPAEAAPEVSVIVPVYNGERFIRRCVESILRSTFPSEKMEVICVDNNSTDRTYGILQSFGSAIQLLQETKRGVSAARNAGLRRARGTFVAFTDADCAVAHDWLANIIAPLKTGQARAVGGRILARPEAGAVERFGELIHDHRKAIEFDRPPYIISMNLASTRDLLLSIGGFDERWIRAQDVEISFRMAAAGMQLAYCHEAVIFHHNRDTVPTLMREGFTHGYYGAAFVKAYADLIREYCLKTENDQAEINPKLEPPNPRLQQWQIDLLWKVFNGAKKAGSLIGRRFPPVIIE